MMAIFSFLWDEGETFVFYRDEIRDPSDAFRDVVNCDVRFHSVHRFPIALIVYPLAVIEYHAGEKSITACTFAGDGSVKPRSSKVSDHRERDIFESNNAMCQTTDRTRFLFIEFDKLRKEGRPPV